MSFFDRNRSELVKQGIDPRRLPPGQYFTDRFPVLHVGDVPTYDLATWTLRVFGLVDTEISLGWSDLLALPSTEITTDIHCVTKWSKFDTVWKGVKLADLFALAGLRPEASFVIEHAEYGYTTNVPLADATFDNCLVAYEFDGQPIEPIHGGPVRIVVPHLYFWKSAKWVRGLELTNADQAGFWERNGYHMYGDPFLEQRHWGD
jgi:DMSO/TMAO reductase YedYZ molybdopterin-dependent catalytic subunit